ncbi:MAG TPA: AI-2E family transporter YdiK [Terriglobales bacterium]|nr:AI-2E family transporter YdiK [Terriglobales bacterium]
MEAGRPGGLVRNMLAVLFVGALIGGSIWILRPFLPALIWATLLVVSTWPLMLGVQERLWNRRGLAVLVMTAALVLIVIIPMALVAAAIVDNAAVMGERLHDLTLTQIPGPPAWVADIPMVGAKLADEWQSMAALSTDDLYRYAEPWAATVGKWLIAKAGTLLLFFVHLLLTVILSALLYYRGEHVASSVRHFGRRLAGDAGEEAVKLAGQAVRAVAMGVIVTALIQTLLGGIGLFLAGVPLVAFLTAVMLVLAIAQIGAVPVLALAVAWLYWHDNMIAATVLLVWTLFVGSIDNVIRPILIKRGAHLPLILIFAGVAGGLIGFGVVGLFIGPVILAVSYTLLAGWIRDGGGERPTRPDPAAPDPM